MYKMLRDCDIYKKCQTPVPRALYSSSMSSVASKLKPVSLRVIARSPVPSKNACSSSMVFNSIC